MTARRRSRRRPLIDFASRSPRHAAGVWLLRTVILAAIALVTYLLVINVFLPNMVDDFIDVIRGMSR
jgi:hypothetical protein